MHLLSQSVPFLENYEAFGVREGMGSVGCIHIQPSRRAASSISTDSLSQRRYRDILLCLIPSRSRPLRILFVEICLFKTLNYVRSVLSHYPD